MIIDGTLLRIDRVGMAAGRDRPYYSGKHKCHGVNVQVMADPAGRLMWASPALPGARHDMGAAREHGLIDALRATGITVIADNGYRGAGFEVPQRRRPRDPETGRRRLSRNQRDVNAAHARQRGPGERANAQLKSWKILRKIRCCPHRATDLVKAVLVLIHAADRKWKRFTDQLSRTELRGRASPAVSAGPRPRSSHGGRPGDGDKQRSVELRHRLAVRQRRTPRPRMTWTGRGRIVALTRLLPVRRRSTPARPHPAPLAPGGGVRPGPKPAPCAGDTSAGSWPNDDRTAPS